MTKEELYKALKEQKEEMTAGERMNAYLKGEEVDCIPYGLLAPEDAMAQNWGFTKGEVYRSFDVRCEIIRRKKEIYGFTGLGVGLGLRGMGEAAGSILKYPETSVDYVLEHCVKDYSYLDEHEFNAETNLFFKEKIEEAKRLIDMFPNMGMSTDVAGPISTAIAMRPIELLLRDMRRRPEEVHRLLDFAVEGSLAWVRLFCKELGNCSVAISDPVTTTDILGKKYFDEFSKPYLKKLVDGIKEITGNVPSAHICGHTHTIWEDLMEIGINNFSLDNCEDLASAKKVMGNKVFLSGNVAPVDAMRLGTIDTVIEAVKKSIFEGCDSPSGYMLMTGCQVPMGTPPENMDAYIYAARKYGAGAKMGHLCKGLEK